jgi:AsmA protein
MKKVLLVLFGVIVVVIAAAVIVPFLLPTDTYKRQIEAQVERTTGRKLVIDGPLDFSVLPTAAVTAADVRFANVEGGAAPDMVRLKGLEAELKVWPLLSGSVEVARFVLIEPEFHLEIDAEGRPNWELGATSPEETATESEAPAQEDRAGGTDALSEAGGGTGLPVSEVKLGDIRIENGTLTFADARSGTAERIEAINVDLDLPDLRSRLQADGSLAYKGETIELALAVERPLDLVQGGSSPVRLSGEAPDLALTFEGGVDAAAPGATGAVELSVASIRDLAAWLAEPIEFDGEGLRTLRVTGQLEGSPAQIAFNDAALALDAIEGQGNVAVDLSGAVPRLTGRLDLGAVDLNPYLAPATTGRESTADGESTEATSRPDRERAGDRAGSADTSGGWSDEPIELPPIGGIEVDFQLAVDSLRMNEVQLDRSVLAVRLKDQRLRADLEEMALYGGQGSGRLDVEIADGAPKISQRFRLKGLDARPFLEDVAEFERLEGKANADLTLETRGRTQRELVQNLNGEGEAIFRDGAVVGINIAQMVRNVTSALQGGAGGEERKTDFAKLSGTFKIRNGILTNDDLRLQAPVLRIAGSGTLNLPQRTVDYRIEPKAAKTLEGQGGKREVAGLLVPVVVRGPWDDLSFTPDVSGVVQRALEDPEAFREGVEEQIDQLDDVGDAIEEGSPEDAVRGLLGRGGGAGDKEKSGGDAAGKLLKGLLGN